MREPLSGWRGDDGVVSVWYAKQVRLCVSPNADANPVLWGVDVFGYQGGMTCVAGGEEPTRLAAQIAAEDAARAMVADMAAALGGSVTWPTDGGE